MPHGIIRSTLFTLAGAFGLQAAFSHDNLAEQYKKMSPNDIATLTITDADRQYNEEIRMAVNERTGSVFVKVSQDCRMETIANRSVTPGAAFEKCIARELEHGYVVADHEPKGQASEKYKKAVIAASEEKAHVVSGISAFFILGGLAGLGCGLRKRKQNNTAAPKPAVM